MEVCNYEAVNTDDQNFHKYVIQYPWKYLFRQTVIASATWALYFSAGLCVGTPTVLIPQLRREMNSTVIDDEMTSWLYSSFGFAAIPWVIFIPTFSTYVGRKPPYLISCVSMLVAFVILYFSVTPYHIIISEVFQGFTHASNITITVIIVSEYSDPKYRGVFLSIKSASFFWGIWAANAIGTFFHWKYIAVIGILCSSYTFVGAFHPESPNWLASKGKYQKSKSAFRWLHGPSESSEKELRSIIDSQTDRKRNIERRHSRNWRGIVQTLSKRQFYMPLGLSLLMSFQYNFSGKIICSTYAIDIIKRMTGNEKAAYTGMLVLDGVTVIGMYIGSFASKILKRRTLYLTSSFVGVAFLLILAFYLYLIELGIFHESNAVSIVLLMIYSVSISCGPMIMAMTLTGEIIPSRYQAVCFSIQATQFSVLITLLVKYAPIIFNSFKMHGSFLFFGVTSGACTVLLYFYLPETKDKTLLEIEEYFHDPKDKVTENRNGSEM